MTSRLRRLAPVLYPVVLFLAALWILHRELRQFRYQAVAGYLRSLPRWDLGLALALTVGSYWMLTAYDVLGFRYAGRRLAYRRVAAASFIGYSFTNSVGHALLTGMPIRFRLYSAWGVATEEIARVVAFGFLTFWTGFLSLSGVVFSSSRAACRRPSACRSSASCRSGSPFWR